MNSIPENMAVNAPTVVELQSQSLFVTQDPDMDIDRAPSLQLETQTRSTKKRNSPPVNYDSDNDADIMEEMAPAATAWKRRRLADETARRRGSESRPLPPVPKETPAPKVQPVKKVEKEVDVVDVARKQREQAEELARTEREALEVELEGMDIEAIRNLVIVEEMEVRRSDPPQRPIRADESDRWDDRWNGKKNFKRFRHRGAVGGRREPGRVIIPLEEAKKKEYGIGDDYWLQGDSYNRKKKDKGRSRDTQDFTQTGSQPSRSKSHAPTTAAEILAREATDNLLDVGIHVNSLSSLDVDVVEAPPKTASTSRSLKSQKLVDKSSKSSNLLPRNKRPASTTLAEPTPVKKAKLAAVEIGESDDSDDELKFRFRKRK
jgi:nijmegen breakage syndrome protein 1